MKLNWVFLLMGCAVLLFAGLLLTPTGSPGGQQEDPKADVMFVLDITGSMQDEIDGVEANLETVLNKLKNNKIDAQVGLTVFRDEKERKGNDFVAGITSDPFTFKFSGGKYFTGDPKEYRDVVKKLKAERGNDIPENSLEGIKHAAEANGRPMAKRFMVLITDAPPHPGKTLDKRIADTRKALLDHKYHQIYLITEKVDRAVYEKIWSSKEHGAWFQLTRTSKAAFAGLLDAITDQMIAYTLKKK